MICENNSYSYAIKRGILSKSISQNSNFDIMDSKINNKSNFTKNIKLINNINNASCTQSLYSPTSIDEKKIKNSNESEKHLNKFSINANDNEKNKNIKREVSRLTKKQQIILQKTFASIKDQAVSNGIKMLLMMFAKHPQYKNIWPQFRPYPDSSLMCAPELSKHAKVYMKGLENIILSLTDEEELCQTLQKIAKAHTKWNIHKKHVMHTLEQVLIMLTDEIGSLSNEEKEAWTILYDVIANIVDILSGRV